MGRSCSDLDKNLCFMAAFANVRGHCSESHEGLAIISPISSILLRSEMEPGNLHSCYMSRELPI